MVKSQILNGQIPNPKWSNPKRSNPKSLPAVSNWAAISISVLRQKVLHRLGERGRDLPQSFFSFTSRVHIWKISVLTAYRCYFFFSPSLIPRWVPWMNQMNFHEMQEKKEKAISLPPILNSVTNSWMNPHPTNFSSKIFSVKDHKSTYTQDRWK